MGLFLPKAHSKMESLESLVAYPPLGSQERIEAVRPNGNKVTEFQFQVYDALVQVLHFLTTLSRFILY
jgi:hypothetical protein